MAASGPSTRHAPADPAISREGIERQNPEIPLRSSVSHAISSWDNHRQPVYHFGANAPAMTAGATVRKWRAESPGAWPAPSYYGSNSGKQGRPPSRARDSPPPPEVYRHGSMNSLDRRLPIPHIEAARNPASGLIFNGVPPIRSARTSPQPGGPTSQVERQERRATQDGDEAAYWSGFEDGIQYERQRQAFEHRSGPYSAL